MGAIVRLLNRLLLLRRNGVPTAATDTAPASWKLLIGVSTELIDGPGTHQLGALKVTPNATQERVDRGFITSKPRERPGASILCMLA